MFFTFICLYLRVRSIYYPWTDNFRLHNYYEIYFLSTLCHGELMKDSLCPDTPIHDFSTTRVTQFCMKEEETNKEATYSFLLISFMWKTDLHSGNSGKLKARANHASRVRNFHYQHN